MDNGLGKKLNSLEKRKPLRIDMRKKLLGSLPKPLPEDYLDYIKSNSGGAFGFLGKYYIDPWGLNTILEIYNQHNNELAQNLIIFASDEGGMGFSIAKKEVPIKIFELPFESLSELKFIGNTFNEFFDYFINTFNR